uniref:Uncharacterized protein n=1 Tax=Cacopsylla melanoneura TaxID=428564 RepID=A0A8D8QT41_9HEMI
MCRVSSILHCFHTLCLVLFLRSFDFDLYFLMKSFNEKTKRKTDGKINTVEKFLEPIQKEKGKRRKFLKTAFFFWSRLEIFFLKFLFRTQGEKNFLHNMLSCYDSNQ